MPRTGEKTTHPAGSEPCRVVRHSLRARRRAATARARRLVAVLALVAAWFAFGPGQEARAQVFVPNNWTLLPNGVSDGDSFRLVFVTSTKKRRPRSDIQNSDAFVQNRAGVGIQAIQDYASEFLVVGCTSSTWVKSHTGTSFDSRSAGLPVYWLNGDKIADTYQEFYAHTGWESNAPTDESGTAVTDADGVVIWYGCNAAEIGWSEEAIGAAMTRIGRPDVSGQELYGSDTLARNQSARFLGMSPLFKVGAPPEVEVTFGAATYARDEGGSVRVVVNLDEDPERTVRIPVNAATGGTATANVDYTGLPATVTFNEGDTSKTITVAFVEDSVDEADETIPLAFGTLPDAVTAGTQSTTTVTIRDDDTADFDLSRTSIPSIPEGASDIFNVSLATQPTANVIVTLSVNSGNVTVSPDQLTFTPMSWSNAPQVEVSAMQDSDWEDGSATVALSAAGGGYDSVTGSVVVTRIDDDDTRSNEIALSVAPTVVAENENEQIEVTATLNLATETTDTVLTVMVDSATGPGHATEEEDFTAVGDFTLTISAGSTSGTGSFTLAATDDNLDEADETVLVKGTTDNSQFRVKPDGGASITIKNTTEDPMVTLVLTPASIGESGVGNVTTVTATLSHPSDEPTTVNVSAAAESPAVPGDFRLTNRTLTIPAGSMASMGTVTVTAVDNEVHAANKQVRITATASNNLGVVPPAAATLTIEEDDTASTEVTLSVSPSGIMENATTADARSVTVVAMLNESARPEATTIKVTVAGGTATVNEDFSAVAAFDLVIATGATSGTATFELAPIDDDLDEDNETVSISGTTTVTELMVGPDDLTVNILDNDLQPQVTLVLDPTSIREDGGVSTVTATLDRKSGDKTTVTVTATAVSPAVAGDFSLSTSNTLTIAAGATTSMGTVTVTAVDNNDTALDKTVTVGGTASNDVGIDGPEEATLTIHDDESMSTEIALSVSPTRIAEDGGGTPVTVTAALNRMHLGSATSLTVSVVSGTGSAAAVSGTDFSTVQDFVIDIPSGMVSATHTLTFTPTDDDVDEPDETALVTGSTVGLTVKPTGGVPLTITDDDAAPTVTLVLTPASVSEADVTTGTTVSATLDHPSSKNTTITVSASPGANAETGDFTVSSNKTLTIVAGQTMSTGVVTVAPVDDNVEIGDKSITVSGTATNDQGIVQPGAVTLTITEDDEPSTMVTLSLDPASVSESATGSALNVTVTAELDKAAGTAPTVVTVSVAAGTATQGTDFGAVTPFPVTIPAGETIGTATFPLNVVNDIIDEPDETLLVTGATPAGGLPVEPSGGLTLTITDDDPEPKVTLGLEPTSISEAGGVSTVTAAIDHPSSADTVVTVSVTPVAPAVAGDFSLSEDRTLTIEAGQTTSTGDVTITAINNFVDSPDKKVTVSGAVVNQVGFVAPPLIDLTITDEDTASTVATLSLSPASINEGDTTGREITVLATLNAAGRTTDTEISVSVGGTGAGAGTAEEGVDYTAVTDVTLRIDAGETSGTAKFDLIPRQDVVDEANETVVVRGTTDVSGLNVGPAAGLPISIVDDDATPTVTLVLDPESISEMGGTSTVTAALNHPSSEETVVTVSTAAGDDTSADDYTESTNLALTIAAGSKTSTGTVTVTSVDNGLGDGDKSVIVSATATNQNTVTNPQDVTLTITDDETVSTKITLSRSKPGVLEGSTGTNREIAVTASLDGAPHDEELTVAVSIEDGTAVAGTDYTQVTSFNIVIAAGASSGTATLTLTAFDDDLDEPNETVTLKEPATVGTFDVEPAAGITITIEDNDPAPTVSLILEPASISENGGSSTVRATLSHRSVEETTVTVSAVPGDTATRAEDFTLSADRTLTIAAGATASTGVVTITARNNNVDAPNKVVTVSGSGMNDQGLVDPSTVNLTITDDEDPSTAVTLSVSPGSVSEGAPADAQRVTVTAALNVSARVDSTPIVITVAPGTATQGVDYALVPGFTMTIPAEQISATETFTLTPTDDLVDEHDETVLVRGSTTASGLAVQPATGAVVVIADNEDTPKVTLVLSPASIGEQGASTTVTATLDRASSAVTEVTVSANPVVASGAVAEDFSLSSNRVLTIAAGATSSTGEVTITANDNLVDTANKTVTVSATVTNGVGMLPPDPKSLIIVDNEVTSTEVTLTVSPTSVAEDATGAARTVTVTATLDQAARATPATLTISVADGTAVAGTDYSEVTAFTLVIPAASRIGTATFDLQPLDNAVDEPDRTVTVSGATGEALTVMPAGGVAVTIADDDPPPVVTLVLNPASITEDGGVSTVTATLDRASSDETTITVGVAPTAGTGTSASDYEVSTNRVLTIAAGATVSTGAVTITGVDNLMDHDSRDVTVSASVVNEQGFVEPQAVSLEISDDESPSTQVNLSISADTVAEGDSLQVIVTGALDGAVRENSDTVVSVSVDAGTATVATDYTAVSGVTLTIPQNQLSGTTTFSLATVEDELDERDETVTIKGSTGASGLTVAPAAGIEITITDDEATPTPSLVLVPSNITEAEGTSTVRASLDVRSSVPTLIEISAVPAPGTVTEDEDFSLSAGRTLTIPAGTLASTGTVTLTANDNDTYEPGKSVRVTGQAENDVNIEQPGHVDLTIIEDDTVSSTVTLTVSVTSVAESATGGTQVRVTAELDEAARPAPTEIIVSVGGGTAAAGSDYAAVSAISVVIPADSMSHTGTFTLSTLEDLVDEPDETMLVTGAVSVAGLAVEPAAGITITITDNEATPTATLALDPPAVPEAGGSTTVTAALDIASSLETTITIAAHPVDPAVAGDFSLSTERTLTIPALSLASTGTVTITAVANGVDTQDKSLTVTGAAENLLDVNDPADRTLTILDDDATSTTATLTLVPAGIDEGATGDARNVVVTASLDAAARPEPTSIDLTVVAGTATEGVDFTAVPAFVLIIPAAATSGSATFSLAPFDDTLDEPDETVTVKGPASAGGLTVAPAAGLDVSILDNEDPPTVTLVLSTAEIPEDGGEATVTATLDRRSSARTVIEVGTSAVHPTFERDFTQSGTMLTIAAGDTTSTGSVKITAHDNAFSDTNKAVAVSGTAANDVGITQPEVVTLAISDDEFATSRVVLNLGPKAVSEFDLEGTVTVSASVNGAELASDVEISLTVAGGTATRGADFTTVTDLALTIPAGQFSAEVKFTVTVVEDAIDEPDETIIVSPTLENQADHPGLTLSYEGSLVMEIRDVNRAPKVTLDLAPESIPEKDGTSHVTAVLDGLSSAETVVEVTVAPVHPATAADFSVEGSTLTIAAGMRESGETITITSMDNDIAAADDKELTVSGSAQNDVDIVQPDLRTLTITDDESPSTEVILTVLPTAVPEDTGGEVTVTATLNGSARSQETVLTISVSSGTALEGTDFAAVSPFTLTIAVGASKGTGMFTLAPVDDETDETDETVRITGGRVSGLDVKPARGVTVKIDDDDPAPVVTLVLTPPSIDEEGGESTVTATLDRPSIQNTTVTVSAVPGNNADTGHYRLSTRRQLTIQAGRRDSTGRVTITAVGDSATDGDRTITVSGAVQNTHGFTGPAPVNLTIEEDDLPRVTLVVTPDSISEASGTAAVTARLDYASGAATTIAVEVVATPPADADDFSVSDTTLTIEAGATESGGTLTITAVDDDVDNVGDKELTLSGTATNDDGVVQPALVTLAITDDESPTTKVILTVGPTAVPEASPTVVTVTAAFDGAPRIQDTVLTISVSAGTAEETADFTAVDDFTLTISAGDTTGTGTFELAPDDDGTDEPDETVRIRGRVTGLDLEPNSGLEVTITDDDDPPQVTLVLSLASIGEDGGESTVTATLDHASSAATTVTVSAAPGDNASADEFRLSGSTLTIPAGQTGSTGTVTIRSVNDSASTGDRVVTVTGTAQNLVGFKPPAAVSLTIEEDDLPKVSLVLTPASISEADGTAEVTAELDYAAETETVVTVTVTPVAPADTGDFMAVGSTLTFAAGDTESSGSVTISAEDDGVSNPDKRLTVSGTVSNDDEVIAPDDVTLTIVDNELASTTVTLGVMPEGVSEGTGGNVVVSATLNRAARAQDTSVTISVLAGTALVTTDFAAVSPFTLIIPAEETVGSGAFALAPEDDDIDEYNETVRITGQVAGLGLAPAGGLTVNIEDDDDPPQVTLVLTPASISEANETSTVTATLNRPSVENTTVTVSAAAGSNASADEFRLSSSTTLRIPAGQTASSGLVTIRSVNDTVSTGDRVVTVTGTTQNQLGFTAPAAVSLTITEDDLPKVSLILSDTQIAESGGTADVTAALDYASNAETVVTVTVTPVAPADTDDFTAVGSTLTIATGALASTGAFTITATDDDVENPGNKELTVSGTVQNTGDGVVVPDDVTLTILDDESPSTTVTLSVAPLSVEEDGGAGNVVVTATFDRAARVQDTTVTISVSSGTALEGTDFTEVTDFPLTIPAESKEGTGTFELAPVDDEIDELDETLRTTGRVSGFRLEPSAALTVTIEDDDPAPQVTLVLEPDSITEANETSRVTATLDRRSSANTTVTVSTAAGTNAQARHFRQSGTRLTIPAGSLTSSGSVTIRSVNDTASDGDRTVTVSATADNDVGITDPSDVSLTITEDDLPKVSLVLGDTSISELDGSTDVTAALDYASNAETVVTVTVTPVAPADSNDFTAVGSTLTIATGALASTGAFTITAIDDNVADPGDKRLTVSGTVSNSGDGVVVPDDVTLTITDNESPSTLVELSVAPDAVSEGAARAVVITADFNRAATREDTVVTISVSPGTALEGTDFTEVMDFPLTIPAESLQGTGTFTLQPVDDAIDEHDETVRITGRVSGFGIDPSGGLTVTIQDDDPAPSVTLVLNPASIGEYDGRSTVTATIDRASSAVTTVTVTATAGNNADADNFRQSGTRLTIRAGQTTSTGTVTLRAVNDVFNTGDRTITVTGTADNDVGITAPSAVNLTITEDDRPSTTVTLTVSPDRVSEGSPRSVTVTAALDAAPRTEDLAIDLSVRDGTAAAGTDFAAVSDFTLTIASGARNGSASFQLSPVDNKRVETSINLFVGGPASVSGLDVEPTSGVEVTIEEDDVRGVAVTPSELSVEEGATGTYLLALTSEPTGTVTIGVASNDTEVTVAPASLSFSTSTWNVAQTVTVSVADDDEVEPDGSAAIAHSVGGADYGTAGVTAGSVAVTIPGLEIGADGETVMLYVPSTGVVTVPEGTEAPAGVQIVLPAGTSGSTLSVRAVDESDEPVEPPHGFRAGTTVVDIELEGGGLAPGETATVCLPVENAGGRDRVYRYDEDASPPEWVELDEPEGGSPEGLVCGVTDHFSMFTVGTAPVGTVSKEWLARFARTVAGHVLDGVQERMGAVRKAGFDGTILGHRPRPADTAAWDAAVIGSRGREDALADPWEEALQDERSTRSFDMRDFLTRSAFSLTAGSDGTGYGALWARGAHTRFGGSTVDLRLDGEVTTSTLGADFTRGGWLGGLALAHSAGDGSWRSEADNGEITVSMTGLFPYLGFGLTDRFSTWATGGFGEGDLRLQPERGEPTKTGTRMTMAAGGVRGEVSSRLAEERGIEAALTADVLAVQVTSEAAEDLDAAEGSVGRVRVGLEGTRTIDLGNGSSIAPSVELGLRHDSGDAEEGLGMGVATGVEFADPARGLSSRIDVHGLLVHEDVNFEEWGVSGSVAIDASPSTGRGMSLSISRWIGTGPGAGGADALLGPETMSGLVPDGDGSAANGRLEAEAGYGFGVFGGDFTGTPYVGLGRSEGQREWRLGWRLGSAHRNDLDLTFGVEATRDEDPTDRARVHGLSIRSTLRW